ncbi:MAG TPA: glycosyltransferase family 87 protein [Candidatus Saccharimonadales bacterium]|nr:glycosyltransferase family 87 protein [Candidatus Saccharimonadales bacterium]
MKFKLIFVAYLLVFIGLFLYSFTQIDLGLVISRYPFFYGIEKTFQYVGYFQRPLSTTLYIGILLILSSLYFLMLKLSSDKKVEKRFVWKLIFASAVILVFSYSAFSYDIFNYIFDAKIVTHYHANPYIHKALDYPGDPMLSFMHWTQRIYPYGPFWLALTVPLSFIGLQIFLPTFFLFKILAAVSYVGSLYFIGKIFQKIKPEKESFGLIFFGLSPLIIIESLVSAHIDIVMMFFSLMALDFLLQKKYILSYASLGISIGIKFLTGLMLPFFIWIHVLQQKKKKINFEKIFGLGLLLLLIGVVVETKQTDNFQSWYLIVPLSFAVFLSHKYYVLIPSVIISFFAMLLYIPFLYTGNWNPPIPQILLDIMLVSYVVSLLGVGITFFRRR